MNWFISILPLIFTIFLASNAPAQTLGGGSQGGGGLASSKVSLRVDQNGCKEGSRGMMTVRTYQDRISHEFRTCRNGTYMNDAELAAYVRVPRRCTEKAKRTEVVYDQESDRNVRRTKICIQGKWVFFNARN